MKRILEWELSVVISNWSMDSKCSYPNTPHPTPTQPRTGVKKKRKSQKDLHYDNITWIWRLADVYFRGYVKPLKSEITAFLTLKVYIIHHGTAILQVYHRYGKGMNVMLLDILGFQLIRILKSRLWITTKQQTSKGGSSNIYHHCLS